MKEFLTLNEATKVLGISSHLITCWVEQGLLGSRQVSGKQRFRHDDLLHVYETETMKTIARSHKILIIEDDILVGETLKNLLNKFGYEVSIASVGLAALDLASRENFALIISDIRMPGMNGIETLKAIRVLRLEFGLPRLPEIIMTAFPEGTTREDADRMGIDDFILKPFSISTFLAAVRKHVEKNKQTLDEHTKSVSQNQNTKMGNQSLSN